MWIFDSYYKDCVELWGRERGLSNVSAAYPPSFYMHLKDPHAHLDLIEGLESRYRVEECSYFRSHAPLGHGRPLDTLQFLGGVTTVTFLARIV